jgi:hypothetical protein
MRTISNYSLFTVINLFILPILYILFDIEKLNNISAYLQYIILFIMLLIYPLWNLRYPSEKLFKVTPYYNAILEYENLKKIAYVLSPLFVFALFLIMLNNFNKDTTNLDLYKKFAVVIFPFFILMDSILLKIILTRVRKDFYYYFAKTYIFNFCKDEKNDLKKMKYLINGLSKYNLFLRKNIGLHIDRLDNIYSMILSKFKHNEKKHITELISSFENNDKMKPIEYLFTLVNDKDIDNFLIKETKIQKIIDIAPILGALVPLFTSFLLRLSGLSNGT